MSNWTISTTSNTNSISYGYCPSCHQPYPCSCSTAHISPNCQNCGSPNGYCSCSSSGPYPYGTSTTYTPFVTTSLPVHLTDVLFYNPLTEEQITLTPLNLYAEIDEKDPDNLNIHITELKLPLSYKVFILKVGESMGIITPPILVKLSYNRDDQQAQSAFLVLHGPVQITKQHYVISQGRFFTVSNNFTLIKLLAGMRKLDSRPR